MGVSTFVILLGWEWSCILFGFQWGQSRPQTDPTQPATHTPTDPAASTLTNSAMVASSFSQSPSLADWINAPSLAGVDAAAALNEGRGI